MIRHEILNKSGDVDDSIRYADRFAALGTEARVRIMRLLLSAHPDGLVVGDIQAELDIPNSTLSHHLEKLRHEDLVTVRREGTFLRYAADTETLAELLQAIRQSQHRVLGLDGVRAGDEQQPLPGADLLAAQFNHLSSSARRAEITVRLVSPWCSPSYLDAPQRRERTRRTVDVGQTVYS